MKAKHHLLAAALALVAAKNTGAQSVHYKVLYDNPYEIKKLHVHLDPFYMDLGAGNLTMGWGARGNFYVGRLGALNLDFRRAYFDMMEKAVGDGTTNAAPVRGSKPYFYFEPGIDFNLMDKTRARSLKVTLSSSSYSSGGYTYTDEKYIMVDGTQRKVFSLHGGIAFWHTMVDIGNATGTKNNDGTTTSELFATSSSASDTLRAGHTLMSSVIIAGGISTKSITNLAIACDWGNRGNSILSHFYADFLFAPVITMEDVKYNNNIYKLNDGARKRTGWRLGWEYHKPNKTFMSEKIEFGSRPGMKGKGSWGNAYLEMTVGFNLAFMGGE
jgi:hypothetical protein